MIPSPAAWAADAVRGIEIDPAATLAAARQAMAVPELAREAALFAVAHAHKAMLPVTTRTLLGEAHDILRDDPAALAATAAAWRTSLDREIVPDTAVTAAAHGLRKPGFAKPGVAYILQNANRLSPDCLVKSCEAVADVVAPGSLDAETAADRWKHGFPKIATFHDPDRWWQRLAHAVQHPVLSTAAHAVLDTVTRTMAEANPSAAPYRLAEMATRVEEGSQAEHRLVDWWNRTVTALEMQSVEKAHNAAGYAVEIWKKASPGGNLWRYAMAVEAMLPLQVAEPEPAAAQAARVIGVAPRQATHTGLRL